MKLFYFNLKIKNKDVMRINVKMEQNAKLMVTAMNVNVKIMAILESTVKIVNCFSFIYLKKFSH